MPVFDCSLTCDYGWSQLRKKNDLVFGQTKCSAADRRNSRRILDSGRESIGAYVCTMCPAVSNARREYSHEAAE